MADQVESRDIEDLLASIRRLVSEDGGSSGAAVRAVAEALDDAGQVQSTETLVASEDARLVLTPQLRVTEPEDPYQMIRQLAEEDQGVAPETEIFSKVDVVPEADPQSAVPTSQESLETATAPEDTAETDPAVQDYTEPTFQHTARVRDAAAGPDPTDIEAPFVEAVEESPEDIVTTFRRLDRRKARAERLAAQEAETTDVQSEADEADALMSAAEAESVSDATDLAAEVELMAPEAAPEAPVEGLLDEEQLREIIADVVREELAGHLGERITRNVRKLVRRELRQIMASEEFD